MARLGYLISQYPTIPHTYILREIRGLRELGLEIHVASILRPDRETARLDAAERVEEAQTFYVRASASRWFVDHLQTLFTRPLDYVRGFAFAVRTSRWDLSLLVRHLLFFAEAVAVGCWMRRSRVAVLHTHFASATATIAAKIFGVGLSMTLHGSAEFVEPERFCMREKLAAAAMVIAISNFGASQIMRFSDPSDWWKINVVRLGVNPDDFPLRSMRARREVFEVICVGSLAPVKAHRVLIQAVATLLAEGRRIRLTIVGGGTERSALEAFAAQIGIRQNVAFTGPIPNEKARQMVADADAFVLTSFAEGVPVVLMEAMALGTPCASTWVTGVPELIRNGEEGLLCEPANPDATAACIRRLMDDAPLVARIVEAARKKVLAEYDQRHNVEKLAAELRKLL